MRLCQHIAHVRHDANIEGQGANLDPRDARQQFIDLNWYVYATNRHRKPFTPSSILPQTIRLDQVNACIGQRKARHEPQLGAGKIPRYLKEDLWVSTGRADVEVANNVIHQLLS